MTVAPLDPLMVELFRRLPPPDAHWPKEQQAVWLRAAIAIADLVYGPTSPPIHVRLVPFELNAERDAGMRERG